MDAEVDAGSQGLTEWRSVQLEQVLREYELVDFNEGSTTLQHGPYLIVAERPVKLAGEPNISLGSALGELGYTSMSPWTAWTRQELNPKLRDKQGIRQYYDMKRNDGTIRGSLRLVKTPSLAANWFMVPASDSTIDKNIAKFVEENLFDELNVDWTTLLQDILLMYDYGYMPFEKVYTIDPKTGKAKLKKLMPLHPLDIQEWVYDDHGGPAGVVMEPFVPYGSQFGGDSIVDQFPGGMFSTGPFISIRKLAIFSFEAEAGDLSGISILRSAYKHWYYKDTLYKIDAIAKERHGIGIPIIVLPPGYGDDDKKKADELGRNLRTNDRAHIVIPANWQVMFAELKGQPVSAIESINHHDMQILANVLGQFVGDASAKDQIIDVFYKSVRYMADMVANIFNKHIIRQLVDLNFKNGGYPKLNARRIGEWDDLRTLSFAVRNFVGAGLITPDDTLEAQLREESDLPPIDMATRRQVPTPQQPGQPAPGQPAPGQDANVPGKPTPPKVGPPRQAQKASVQPPAKNAGRDGGG